MNGHDERSRLSTAQARIVLRPLGLHPDLWEAAAVAAWPAAPATLPTWWTLALTALDYWSVRRDGTTCFYLPSYLVRDAVTSLRLLGVRVEVVVKAR